MSIHDSQIAWINGPFPAATGDLQIFRVPGGLRDSMPPGKRLIGDSGYAGEQPLVTIRNAADSNEVQTFKRRVRARLENINSRIKKFSIRSDRFRHAVEKHVFIFGAVCVLVQFEMNNGHPLFDV